MYNIYTPRLTDLSYKTPAYNTPLHNHHIDNASLYAQIDHLRG